MPTSQPSRSGPAATARLTGWFTPVVTAAGYDLEDLEVRSAGTRSVVRVVVDRDSGVSLDDVAEVSRALSEVLDAEDDDPGRSPYVLEVTSPGVDRPLTLPRHWRRNVGRLVTTAVDGQELIGRVVSVDDDGVTLAVEKGGAKKGQVRKAAGNRTLTWAELGEGRVQVEFNRPAGHRDAHLVHEGPDEGDDTDDTDETDDESLTADDVDDELDEHDGSADAAAQDRGEQ
ncbi:ribosome maturation factor RimP [Klenkia marina]|uniref:Ribosome maturation factor RimP n=1 Tax=Klenkia marina TaxID=1960309 RepID=A0A1G4YIR0_9ACTN|nr:ribosome maturation factor RimP [Klenkia marina]SCX53351.1 ribosome maturation factor RimP [Klenkia marina]